jgi:hypothetical protein
MSAIYKTRTKKVHKFFKLGNKKIGYDTLIFNLGTAKHCPSKALGLCKFENDFKSLRKGKTVCYACKMEWAKNVLNYRKNQLKYWLSEKTSKIITDINRILEKHQSNYGIKYLRFNEAGDFHTLKDILRIQKIADFTGLRVYTYTHRKDLIDKLIKLGYKPTQNFVINLSGFKRKGWNTFKTVSKKTFKRYQKQNKFCCKMDCTQCDYCKYQDGITIYVPNH